VVLEVADRFEHFTHGHHLFRVPADVAGPRLTPFFPQQLISLYSTFSIEIHKLAESLSTYQCMCQRCGKTVWSSLLHFHHAHFNVDLGQCNLNGVYCFCEKVIAQNANVMDHGFGAHEQAFVSDMTVLFHQSLTITW
jgi:hypothetical protein